MQAQTVENILHSLCYIIKMAIFAAEHKMI